MRWSIELSIRSQKIKDKDCGLDFPLPFLSEVGDGHYIVKNSIIGRRISSNNIVTKFKYDMRLDYLNLEICIVCTGKNPYHKWGTKQATNV